MTEIEQAILRVFNGDGHEGFVKARASVVINRAINSLPTPVFSDTVKAVLWEMVSDGKLVYTPDRYIALPVTGIATTERPINKAKVWGDQITSIDKQIADLETRREALVLEQPKFIIGDFCATVTDSGSLRTSLGYLLPGDIPDFIRWLSDTFDVDLWQV